MTVSLAACQKPAVNPPLQPLGPDAKKVLRIDQPKSLFDPLFVPSCKPSPTATPKKEAVAKRIPIISGRSDPARVDHSGRYERSPLHRHGGRTAQIIATPSSTITKATRTRTGKKASYNQVDIAFNMPDRIVQMSGAFDDYFNRAFVNASLTTKGLTGKYPLTLNGSASPPSMCATPTDAIRTSSSRRADRFPNAAALALAFENLLKQRRRSRTRGSHARPVATKSTASWTTSKRRKVPSSA